MTSHSHHRPSTGSELDGANRSQYPAAVAAPPVGRGAAGTGTIVCVSLDPEPIYGKIISEKDGGDLYAARAFKRDCMGLSSNWMC